MIVNATHVLTSSALCILHAQARSVTLARQTILVTEPAYSHCHLILAPKSPRRLRHCCTASHLNNSGNNRILHSAGS